MATDPNTIPSVNMKLPVPIVGQDQGPDWASNINTSLTIIDQHDHTNGSGVPITPGGLNINSDLPFAGNNITQLRSLRLQPQAPPIPATSPDITCLYVSGVDLYYNDGTGLQIPITANGGVAGSPGSIANLAAPASASYSAGSSTFVFQSDVNTPADLDAASILLRNLTANSKALTLNPPASMGVDYTLNLPALPGATSFVTLDTSGNFGTSIPISLGIQTSNIADLAVTTAKIADTAVTNAKVADGTLQNAKLATSNIVFSASSGNFTTTSTSITSVTNLAINITTTRYVDVQINPYSDGNTSTLGALIDATGVTNVDPGGVVVQLWRNGNAIATWKMVGYQSQVSQPIIWPANMRILDNPPAQTNTYEVLVSAVRLSGYTVTVQVFNLQLVALEIGI